ncbi:hypothetical protein QFZ55_000126 [Streptomyces luteogriseus]|nr:hypothetical protein [Streptomyces luteogriseus]
MREELCAWGKLRGGAGEVTAGALRAYATGKLTYCKIPRHVLVVDEFPITVTGRCFSWRLEATGTEQRTHCTRPMVCHGIQRLHHQLVGELDLRLESFHRANDHEQTLATYYAEPGSPSAEVLRLLASWGTDATRAGAGMPSARTA